MLSRGDAFDPVVIVHAVFCHPHTSPSSCANWASGASSCGYERAPSTSPRFRSDLTSVKLQATIRRVKIRGFANKALRRLYVENTAKGLPPDTVDKLRKMLAFLDDMQEVEELRSLPAWKVHALTGDRKGTWSLSVTRNRRLTFRVDAAEREIYEVNLEDYH